VCQTEKCACDMMQADLCNKGMKGTPDRLTVYVHAMNCIAGFVATLLLLNYLDVEATLQLCVSLVYA